MRQIYRRISPELSVPGHETRAYVKFRFVRTFYTIDRSIDLPFYEHTACILQQYRFFFLSQPGATWK